MKIWISGTGLHLDVLNEILLTVRPQTAHFCTSTKEQANFLLFEVIYSYCNG